MTEQTTVDGRRLGKREPKVDPRTLQLARYLKPEALPAAPSVVDWAKAVPSYPMFGNDQWGDCAEADSGHTIQTWIGNTGGTVNITAQNVISWYSAVTGFNPNDPSTDQGTYWLDLLNYWRKTGLKDADGKVHQIVAFVQVNPTNLVELKQAVNLFGAVQLGVALPISAQSQVGKVWTVGRGANGAPGSWGGHAVPLVRYDKTYATIVTWGALQKMTYGFVTKYVDEAYVALSQEWINRASQKAPSGFDLATLQADLQQFHH